MVLVVVVDDEEAKGDAEKDVAVIFDVAATLGAAATGVDVNLTLFFLICKSASSTAAASIAFSPTVAVFDADDADDEDDAVMT